MKKIFVVFIVLLSTFVRSEDLESPFLFGETLMVWGSSVVVRDGPSRQYGFVTSLKEYDLVEFTGQYTVEPVTITLRGEKITASYVSIRTASGKEGWVFSGLLQKIDKESLLKKKIGLITLGSPIELVETYYGKDPLLHSAKSRNEESLFIVNTLGVELAWEYYDFRSAEGIVFGLKDGLVESIMIRQESDDYPMHNFWRSVEGYKNYPLKEQCHLDQTQADCSNYRL